MKIIKANVNRKNTKNVIPLEAYHLAQKAKDEGLTYIEKEKFYMLTKQLEFRGARKPEVERMFDQFNALVTFLEQCCHVETLEEESHMLELYIDWVYECFDKLKVKDQK